MTVTTKYNRAELLQLALDGKVKRGDKFKDERGTEVTFDGLEFVWKDGGSLKLFVHTNEHFTPVVEDKEVTITLKQSEVNALRLVLGKSSYSSTERSAERLSLSIPESRDYQRLYEKLLSLTK
ncbi:hypothetical protein CN613_25570 [Bacillus pseudomycoides]|uniref:Uncharacterized protein n=1 Tax=Bacillus pseudomycoides TaxID=64104 RepID=A0A2A8BYH6_9BACI|nr:hypothetical protein [Bacillus pseudomycoides]PEM65316.1 hypothetical protein CN613_25570 [Bacillus pseudomycoides]